MCCGCVEGVAYLLSDRQVGAEAERINSVQLTVEYAPHKAMASQ